MFVRLNLCWWLGRSRTKTREESSRCRANMQSKNRQLHRLEYQQLNVIPHCHDEMHEKQVRPGSDAELFMSRTQFEFGPTQINKSTPVDSDAELN